MCRNSTTHRRGPGSTRIYVYDPKPTLGTPFLAAETIDLVKHARSALEGTRTQRSNLSAHNYLSSILVKAWLNGTTCRPGVCRGCGLGGPHAQRRADEERGVNAEAGGNGAKSP